MKKAIITIFLCIAVMVSVFLGFQEYKLPKLKNIKIIRVEYNQRLIDSLSLDSPLEINNPEQIDKLVDGFNVKSEYDIGCSCPSHDIIIHFISEEREYVYNIGITGDCRIQYSKNPEEDILGIDIDSIIDILSKNKGSENLKYPY